MILLYLSFEWYNDKVRTKVKMCSFCLSLYGIVSLGILAIKLIRYGQQFSVNTYFSNLRNSTVKSHTSLTVLINKRSSGECTPRRVGP